MMKNKERRSERRRIEKEKFGTIQDKKKKRADDLLLPPPLPLPIGRSFFKVMIGNYKELMDLNLILENFFWEANNKLKAHPPKFARTVGFLKNRHVCIGDSSGDTWRVKVTVVDSSLVFQEGWENFVLDHSITVGELVTFKYMGGRLFHALLYDTHACDRAYSPKKSNTESGRKRPISNMWIDERPHFHKMQKTSEPVVEDSYIPSNGAISGNGRTRPATSMPSEEESYFTRARKTSEVSKDEHIPADVGKKVASAEFSGTGITESPHLLEKLRKAPPEPKEGHFNVASKEPSDPRPYGTEFYTDQKDRLKKKVAMRRSKTSETKKQTLRDEKVAAASVDASWEQGDIAYDRSTRTHSASKHRPEYGMENLTIPEVVFYKYLLTEDGKCHIVEESSLLETSPIKSLSPGKKTMEKCVEMDNGNIRPSDAEINFKFSVTLPAQSTWLALPEPLWHVGRMELDRKVIILQDPSMNMWPVVYHARSHFVGFLDGWKDFVIANDLRQGDICEFQAVDRTECTFRVHVSR